MIKESKKTAEDENFPVGMLIRKNLRPVVAAYYKAARLADDIADNPKLDSQEKIAQLDKIERIFCGAETSDEFVPITQLRELFKTENLDSSLYLDLLTAFRRDAVNQPIEIWEQLIDYCNYSAAPVGRFMLAIHDENPSTYLPAATLCAVLQIVNHIQDLKKDAINLRRCYLPSQMMKKHGVVFGDVYLNCTPKQLKSLINEMMDNVKGMMKDAALLPSIVKSRRLKAELGVILSLTNSMVKKIDKGDVLSRHIILSKRDWLKAIGNGIKTGLFQRTKTLGRPHEQY